MAQAVTATIPLQALTPPRMLDELSGQIDKLAPPPRMIDELSGQIGNLAPAAVNEYVRDFWQRSVLFLDILRQRGNQHDEMSARGVTSVLIYDSELVMRGDELPHPVNYSLLRVILPEGAEIDDRNRPVLVIDPRAGQGPGIGGFKQLSEIGEAFKAGHPVYFAGFTASPVVGQRIEDVARAYTIFLEKVAGLHPEALGKALRVRQLPSRLARDDGRLHTARCGRADGDCGRAAFLLGWRPRQECDALSGRLVWRKLA